MIGSPAFRIICDNVPVTSVGLLLVTDSQDLGGSDPFFLGVLVHSDFSAATEVLAFDLVNNLTGQAETPNAAIPNSPALIGKTYFASAFWVWPTTVCVLQNLSPFTYNPYNISTSRGLAITILVP
jgi:hypothetical protein